MPGPSPIPNELKRLRGNPGKRHLPAPVANLAGDPPPMPDDLGVVGEEAWRRLWVAARGWLSPQTDVNIVYRYCQHLDERFCLWSAVADLGYLVEGSKGQLRPNPLLGRIAVVDNQILRMESVLGLTPADRSRLGVAEVKAASTLERLMADARASREAT